MCSSVSISSGLFDYMPHSPFPSLNHFLTFVEQIRADPARVLIVIYDLSLDFDSVTVGPEDERRFAGMISLLRSDSVNLSTEIGRALFIRWTYIHSAAAKHCASR
jgi:hypothetical protein